MQTGNKYIIEIDKVNEDNTYTIKGIDGALEAEELARLEPLDYSPSDVWSIAARLYLSPREGGMDSEEFRKIFGNIESKNNIFLNYSVNEVMTKIKEYEENQKTIQQWMVCQYDTGRYGIVICIEGENAVLYTSDNENITRRLDELTPTERIIPLQNQLQGALMGYAIQHYTK